LKKESDLLYEKVEDILIQAIMMRKQHKF